MKALIVSKTHMGKAACVGAIDIESHKSIRLLNPDGFPQPSDTHLSIGDIWDLDYTVRQDVTPPHVEDVYVHRSTFVSKVDNIVSYIISLNFPIWRGNAESLFDGNIHCSENGTCYAKPNEAKQSVGFWISDRDIIRTDYRSDTQTKIRYAYRTHPRVYTRQKAFSYVGYQDPIDIIPAGTLLRISLARPWAPNENEERKCWLQLSGWYGLENAAEEENDDDDLPF